MALASRCSSLAEGSRRELDARLAFAHFAEDKRANALFLQPALNALGVILADDDDEAEAPVETFGEIALVHRLDHLQVGAISVAVAVRCPHRSEGFAACRHAIDRLKELIPIWKKENVADGSTQWVHPGTE